jgi:two-component system, response regulator PdtaR
MFVQPKTIAIADDELSMRRMLRLACETAYQIVGEAENGGQAVSLVQSLKPQLLILDMHMPGMDGLEVLRQIRPLKTTATVILTADPSTPLARQAMELGASGYLLKPFDAGQLVPMLETAWHHFASELTLTNEIMTLSDNLETRKLVEKAKGILMDQQGMSEDVAHKTLQRLSQDQGISLKEVCRSVIQVKMVLGRLTQKKIA